MDRVANYRQIIKRIIAEYAALKPSYGDIETETIFDESHDHYENDLYRLGRVASRSRHSDSCGHS